MPVQAYQRLAAFAAAFCLLLFLFSSPVLSEGAEEEDVFVAPRLSENAIPWDQRHPELLDADMLYAKSAILIEADTGDVIFEKNADDIMYPASTTKILTAYIALQMGDLNYDEVEISQNAVDLVPPTYTRIPVSPGEVVALKDLIAATLVRSGNEGANAIAEYFSGSIEQFAGLMNEVAGMLGCSESTHFTNPSGVQDDNHYTTARDMAIIARSAMQNTDFADIVARNTYNMPASNKRPARQLVGQTSILDPESDYFYSECRGIKTGFTNRAGYCYIGAAQRGGISLISVVLYSSRAGRWSDTRKLFEYGFTQIQSITPEALYAEDPRVIEIAGFDLDDAQHGNLTLGIRAVDESRDMTIIGRKATIDSLRENFSQISSVTWTREFRAPISVGETMGTLTFFSENKGTAQYDLVATRSIAARENAPPTLEQIEAYTMADENPWPRFSIDLVIPPAIILLLFLMLFRFILKHRRKRIRTPDLQIPQKRLFR
ncbi:MAG: D-alanyl-D-alanine carboxypeptidase [Clostridia bacterium]|nr:D-alanyl-D-alanine carboxypeptidase [Clostridia bacterium]